MLTFCKGHALRDPVTSQLLRVMRITAFILLIFSLHVTAKSVSQTITLTGKDIPLKTVFTEIETQCGYLVLYNRDVVDDRQVLSVEAKREPLLEFLSKTLRAHALDFVIENKTILVKKKPLTPDLKSENKSFNNLLPISGVVHGVDGKPLANVSVTVKGKNIGTTTDAEGRFSIDVNEGDVLVVSSVGFGSKEARINSANQNLVIALDISSSPLDEVQVIAYGETTKRLSTGNITSVTAQDIEKQPITNPILALQGRVPGLVINQNTGVPGGGVTVRIQGQNSIRNGNDPLYVVNGIPYISQMLKTTDGGVLGPSGGPEGSGSGNPLNYINPMDIERIDILKDADATAIYGSRAANGAILITTKKGKSGPAAFNLNIQSGISQVGQRLKVLNTRQYLDMRYEALKNDGVTDIPENNYDLILWDTTKYTDWQKTLTGGYGRFTNINASVSGGTVTSKYLIGVTYNRSTSVFAGNFADQKGNLYFNLNSATADQKFKLELSGSYLSDNNKLPSFDLSGDAIRLAPNAPALYNADGSLNWAATPAGTSSWINPLANTLTVYTNKTNNLVSNAMLDYEVANGIDLKASLGYNRIETNEFTGYPLTWYRPEERPYSVRSAVYTNSIISSWIIEPMMTLKRSLWEGDLNIIVGATVQQRNGDGTKLEAVGFNSDAVLEDIRAASTIYPASSIISVYKYNAGFGRLNYAWKHKYILNLSARRDGTSRFGPENRFHNFGAVGAAWIFSEEKLLNNSRFISFGKLRGGYGTTGNDQIPDYRFFDLYDPISLGVPYNGGTGIIANRLPNPYLQWEETKKLQVGVDIGLLKDRILLNATYVRNRSSNQLLEYSLPTVTGFGTIQTNFPALVQNSAWELSANSANIKTANFVWETRFNITLPKNKLVSFPNLSASTYADQLVEGEPINILKGFRFYSVNTETGLYEFLDNENKPVTVPDFSKDRVVLINTTPRYYGGLENSFQYKGWKLDVLLQFIGQDNANYIFGNPSFQPGRRLINQPVSVLDRWQQPGDIAPVQKFSTSFEASDQYDYLKLSDGYYVDASFIRLKNVSLSYQFASRLIEKAKLKNLRIYLQGQNLFTITNYKGVDPESGISAIWRTVTAGLQVEL